MLCRLHGGRALLSAINAAGPVVALDARIFVVGPVRKLVVARTPRVPTLVDALDEVVGGGEELLPHLKLDDVGDLAIELRHVAQVVLVVRSQHTECCFLNQEFI